MELEGKTAVITGAASGIGLATARRFGEVGARLVLADLEADTLAGVVKEFDAQGVEVLGVPTDVTKEDQVIALRDAALARFGAVHLIFNNAGVAGGAAIGTPTAVWDWVLGVNLHGVVHGINAFLPLLLEQDEGYVVNTGSLAGLAGVPGSGPYSASKFAVVGLSESLFHELAIRGAKVRVAVLCPGFVRTRIHESTRNLPEGLEDYERDPTMQTIAAAAAQAVNAGIDPADVARAVESAVREERFWILPHERVALRTSELRLEWMRGGPPMSFDLMAATRP